MTYKFAFRAVSFFVTAALLCVCVGCFVGSGGGAEFGDEVDAYLGTFNPVPDIKISPEGGGTVYVVLLASGDLVSVFPDDDGDYKYRYRDTVMITAVPESGYMFMGWSGESIDTARSIRVIMDGNKALTAKFNLFYTVVFDANGGSGTPPETDTVPKGSSITLPDKGDLVKAGSSFGGWTNSNGDNFPAGAMFTVNKNDTLYARWGTEYTVTFNQNNGSGTPPKSQTVPAGSSLTLPDSGGLSRSGYAFRGWSANASSGGSYYGAGRTYTPTGNVTLYAVWVGVYTVTFSVNGGSGAAPSSQTVTSGTVITLPKLSDRSGYLFDGWTDDRNHATHQAGTLYTVVGNTVMSANWSPVYTITFNLNGGNGVLPSPRSEKSGTVITLPLLNATRPGYVFDGWNTNFNAVGTYYKVGSEYLVTASAVLYADWRLVGEEEIP